MYSWRCDASARRTTSNQQSSQRTPLAPSDKSSLGGVGASCDILKCHLENVIKKCLQNKPDNHKHNRANRNKFISKTTVNSIITIISKLMKEEISNSVREAGIYAVQIDSTQDILSTDKCSVILRYGMENVKDSVVDSHSATGADLCNLLKEVLQKQNIDVSKCISDSTDGASNMSGQYNGFTAFLEKESPGHIHTWCYAHVLNLVLCDVTTTNHASISPFGLVQKVFYFILFILSLYLSS